MANLKIEEIEGIGPATAEKLLAAGITHTDKMLEAGCTKKGRAEIAEKCGVSEKQILKWVNMADLFRVKGVAGEYAELLECAGVDTVVELATRNAANLATKIKEVNDEKKLTRQVPGESTVQGWIDHAKELPRKVTH